MILFKRLTALVLLIGLLCACQPSGARRARPAPNQARVLPVLDTTMPVASGGRPLLAGQPAPDFRLSSAAGTTMQLADALRAGGPVVLIFYTTPNCRICLEVLRALEARRQAWQASGAHLIAIARQSVADAAVGAQQSGTHYDFLADSDGRVARAYGIWPLLPGRTKIRQSPVTVFIVEPSGVILWTGSALTDGQPAVETILGQLPK